MPQMIDYGHADRRKSPRDLEIAAIILGAIAAGLLAYELPRSWSAVTSGITETVATGGLLCGILALLRPSRYWPLILLGLILSGAVFFGQTVTIILRFSDW